MWVRGEGTGKPEGKGLLGGPRCRWENNIEMDVNKNPTDATVCRYLFTAKLLYMWSNVV